jgi:homospermidine synthase
LDDITQLKGFAGNIVLVGCGSIGQAVLPPLVRDLGPRPARLTVVTADQRGRPVADGLGARFVLVALGPANLQEVIGRYLRAGDFLLNLAVEVDSPELLQFANHRGALYLDTGIEPWPGGYTDPALISGECSSQAFRAKALALRGRIGPGRPTAVICQGANPGLVEPDELDFGRILATARSYLGRLDGAWSDWTPLTGRGRLFPEALGLSDPWRFANVRAA